MLQSKSSEKNKLVPGWIRALIIIPCLAGCTALMIYCGNIFDFIAEVQIGWFDKYYVIVTFLITVVVYLFILVICLIPAAVLIRLVRVFYEKKQNASPDSSNDA
jgi:hypothetical protein